jgi:hypothetical protein
MSLETKMTKVEERAAMMAAVRTLDLGVQMARLRFADEAPCIDIADPPGAETTMQWTVICGRRELATLAHGILEFLAEYPDEDESEENKIP